MKLDWKKKKTGDKKNREEDMTDSPSVSGRKEPFSTLGESGIDPGKGKGESSSPKKEEKEKVGRGRKEFFSNYIITNNDIGKSLFHLINEAETSADAVTHLSPIEDKYLDQLIFTGFVTHEIFLRKNFPVTFRSIPAIGAQRGYDILANERGTQDKLKSLQTCMTLAIYLESYNKVDGEKLRFSHKGLSCEEFLSEEKIKERFDFCRYKLADITVDAMMVRLRDFLSVLGRISLAKNIINF